MKRALALSVLSTIACATGSPQRAETNASHPPLLLPKHYLAMTACLVGIDSAVDSIGRRADFSAVEAQEQCLYGLTFMWNEIDTKATPVAHGCGIGITLAFKAAGIFDELRTQTPRAVRSVKMCADILAVIAKDGAE